MDPAFVLPHGQWEYKGPANHVPPEFQHLNQAPNSNQDHDSSRSFAQPRSDLPASLYERPLRRKFGSAAVQVPSQYAQYSAMMPPVAPGNPPTPAYTPQLDRGSYAARPGSALSDSRSSRQAPPRQLTFKRPASASERPDHAKRILSLQGHAQAQFGNTSSRPPALHSRHLRKLRP